MNYKIKLVPRWLSVFLEERNLSLDVLTQGDLTDILPKGDIELYQLINDSYYIKHWLPDSVLSLGDPKSKSNQLELIQLKLGINELTFEEQCSFLIYGNYANKESNNKNPKLTLTKVGYEYLFFIFDPSNSYSVSFVINEVMHELGTHYPIHTVSSLPIFKPWFKYNVQHTLSLTNSM